MKYRKTLRENGLLSFGRADAVAVVSVSTPLADALATAAGNRIKSTRIPKEIYFLKKVAGRAREGEIKRGSDNQR